MVRAKGMLSGAYVVFVSPRPPSPPGSFRSCLALAGGCLPGGVCGRRPPVGFEVAARWLWAAGAVAKERAKLRGWGDRGMLSRIDEYSREVGRLFGARGPA